MVVQMRSQRFKDIGHILIQPNDAFSCCHSEPRFATGFFSDLIRVAEELLNQASLLLKLDIPFPLYKSMMPRPLLVCLRKLHVHLRGSLPTHRNHRTPVLLPFIHIIKSKNQSASFSPPRFRILLFTIFHFLGDSPVPLSSISNTPAPHRIRTRILTHSKGHDVRPRHHIQLIPCEDICLRE